MLAIELARQLLARGATVEFVMEQTGFSESLIGMLISEQPRYQEIGREGQYVYLTDGVEVYERAHGRQAIYCRLANWPASKAAARLRDPQQRQHVAEYDYDALFSPPSPGSRHTS